jgi:hypothetical protein
MRLLKEMGGTTREDTETTRNRQSLSQIKKGWRKEKRRKLGVVWSTWK